MVASFLRTVPVNISNWQEKVNEGNPMLKDTALKK